MTGYSIAIAVSFYTAGCGWRAADEEDWYLSDDDVRQRTFVPDVRRHALLGDRAELDRAHLLAVHEREQRAAS